MTIGFRLLISLIAEDILPAAIVLDISKQNMTQKQYNMGFCGNTAIKII